MDTKIFEREVWVPAKRDAVFAFFSNAKNLETLTPPWLHFRILTPDPLVMRAGLRIDYQLRLRGLPLRWQSEIILWDPPCRFTDVQRRGPYRLWVHNHTFEARNGGTLVSDMVEYAAPGGRIVEKLLVEPDVRRIFDYRAKQLEHLFNKNPRS